MTNIAIIAAAGWKSVGGHFSHVPPMCPEPLLPLGDGSTPVSRLASQVRAFGFYVYIGVGRPGCLYPKRSEKLLATRNTTADTAKGSHVSPWTEERIEYVRRFGEPVLIDDPDAKNCHDTICQIVDTMSQKYERLLILNGDHLFTHALLHDIVSLRPSFCFKSKDGSQLFFLDTKMAARYRNYAETLRQKLVGHTALSCTKPFGYPNRSGIPVLYMNEEFPGRNGEWIDIDIWSDYERALEWVKRFGKS